MSYLIQVDDNGRYQDETARYSLGRVENFEDAVATAKRLVNEYLVSAMEPGMTAAALYMSYTRFGPDPFISGPGNGVFFSARDYAKQRCDDLCQS